MTTDILSWFFQGVFVKVVNNCNWNGDGSEDGIQVISLKVTCKGGLSRVGRVKHLKKDWSFKVRIFDDSYDENEKYIADLVDEEDNLPISFKIRGKDHLPTYVYLLYLI